MLDAEKGSELAAMAKSGSVAKVLGTPLYVESLGFYFPYRLSHDKDYTLEEKAEMRRACFGIVYVKNHIFLQAFNPIPVSEF